MNSLRQGRSWIFLRDVTCLSTKTNTLPETNSSPLKMMVSNRNLLFQRVISQGSRGSFGFVWFQKSKKEPQSGSCGVGSSAVRFLAVRETVRFYECDSCAT